MSNIIISKSGSDLGLDRKDDQSFCTFNETGENARISKLTFIDVEKFFFFFVILNDFFCFRNLDDGGIINGNDSAGNLEVLDCVFESFLFFFLVLI
jgi:hypothetical protein